MAGSPWTNQVTNLIILTETAGYSGLFGYNGTPAAGNLVLSATTSIGTDAEGNAFINGLTSYEEGTPTAWFATSLQGGFTSMWTATSYAGPWVLAGQINFDNSGDLNLDFTGQTSTQGNLLVNGNMTVTGNLLVDGTLTANILVVDNGASITNGLTIDTINGSTDTGGPNGTGFFNTQGLASGSYGSTHQHTLPNFPTATHNHAI